MRSRLSCSIRGKVDPTGGRTTDWWLKVSNTGVCPLYVVRLSTPIRNGALVRNVIRAGESYEMPAVLPRSVTAGMKGSAEELAAWEDGIVVVPVVRVSLTVASSRRGEMESYTVSARV